MPFGLSSIRAAARTFDASFETRTTDTDRLQRVILVASLTAEGEHSLGALASGVLWKVFGFEEGARAGLGHVHNDWPYGWDMCIMTGLMAGTAHRVCWGVDCRGFRHTERVTCMGENRNGDEVLVGKPEAKCNRGSRRRWECNVEIYLGANEMGGFRVE